MFSRQVLLCFDAVWQGLWKRNTGCPGRCKAVHVCGTCSIFCPSAADSTHMHSSVMATWSRGFAQKKKNGSLVTQGFATMGILGTPAVGTKRQQEHEDFVWFFLLCFTHKLQRLSAFIGKDHTESITNDSCPSCPLFLFPVASFFFFHFFFLRGRNGTAADKAVYLQMFHPWCV